MSIPLAPLAKVPISQSTFTFTYARTIAVQLGTVLLLCLPSVWSLTFRRKWILGILLTAGASAWQNFVLASLSRFQPPYFSPHSWGNLTASAAQGA